MLQQHNWRRLNNVDSKKLYFFLASTTMTPNFTIMFPTRVLQVEHEYYTKMYKQSKNIIKIANKVKSFILKKSEENLYFKRLYADHQKILSFLPKTIMFYDEQSRYLMSKLIVFGPQSFPLLVTFSGAVVMAGAYYGKGKVIVLPHEELLSNVNLLMGSYRFRLYSK